MHSHVNDLHLNRAILNGYWHAPTLVWHKP
jgi:hypothetical protein